MPSKKIENNLLIMNILGWRSLYLFISTRWDETVKQLISFFELIKTLKLMTFCILKSAVKIKLKGRENSLNTHINLIGQLAIMMQARQIDLTHFMPLVSFDTP